jgi:hypothetical protein
MDEEPVPERVVKFSSTLVTGLFFSFNKYCPFKYVQMWYKMVILSLHFKNFIYKYLFYNEYSTIYFSFKLHLGLMKTEFLIR